MKNVPTISVQQSLLRTLMEAQGFVHDIEQVNDELPLLGTDIDACTEEQLDIEIFPRPNLLSGETLAFAMANFLHGAPARPDMDVQPSGITMKVDSEPCDVRPVILGAVVRGVSLPDDSEGCEAFIKGLMDHQEKAPLRTGATPTSIGVHDLARLTPPFHVKTVGEKHAFVPLAREESMTIADMLTQHPKGVEYWTVGRHDQYHPLIVDADDAVLSFPPIINGDHTTVTHDTRDFFIDVTVQGRARLRSIPHACLPAKRFSGAVKWNPLKSRPARGTASSHRSEPGKHVEELVQNLLGRAFTDDELQVAVQRMGGRFEGRQPAPNDARTIRRAWPSPVRRTSELLFTMPQWRFDLLHPVDMVEELAIGHGYEDRPGTDVPKATLTAQPRTDHHLRRRLRASMEGMGMMQIQSLTLSNARTTNLCACDETKPRSYYHHKPHHRGPHRSATTPDARAVEIARQQSTSRPAAVGLRTWSGGSRPHRNCSLAFANRRAKRRICCRSGVASKRSATTWGSAIGWLNRSLLGKARGLPDEVPNLINGTWVGCFELDPAVSSAFDLRVPLNGAEFDVNALMNAVVDPV